MELVFAIDDLYITKGVRKVDSIRAVCDIFDMCRLIR